LVILDVNKNNVIQVAGKLEKKLGHLGAICQHLLAKKVNKAG